MNLVRRYRKDQSAGSDARCAVLAIEGVGHVIGFDLALPRRGGHRERDPFA